MGAVTYYMCMHAYAYMLHACVALLSPDGSCMYVPSFNENKGALICANSLSDRLTLTPLIRQLS